MDVSSDENSNTAFGFMLGFIPIGIGVLLVVPYTIARLFYLFKYREKQRTIDIVFISALHTNGVVMKSKVLFALFTLVIFCSGLVAGVYFGVSAGASPAIGQLWAGAKEMQAIVETIDNGEYEKAKKLACMSIETRIVIMDATKPFGSEVIERQTREVETFFFSNVNKDKKALGELCFAQANS